MLRQYNRLKNSNFTLSDFCTDFEINIFKNYLKSDGTPHEWVPLTIWGEAGAFDDAHRRDNDYSFTVFEGRVQNDDITRADGNDFNTEHLASDRIYLNFVVDNEKF